jgi:hypothetical protein
LARLSRALRRVTEVRNLRDGLWKAVHASFATGATPAAE